MAKYTNNTKKVRGEFRRIGRNGLFRTGQDVLKGAGPRTPKRLNKLRKMTSIKQTSDTSVEVKWSARQAAVQNLGHRRGARPFKRYTTPGTGAGFVETGYEYARKRYKENFK